MSYEAIRVAQDLSASVQRAVGIDPQRHETLGELVKDMARRAALRSEDPVSERPTRHAVEVNGRTFHTNCFGDALALPFVLDDATYDVRSESPTGGVVRATVTKDGVEAAPRDAVMSFGATRVGTGPVQATACPYINAFPSREDYARWAQATPEAVTIALSLDDGFAVVRELVSGGTDGAE